MLFRSAAGQLLGLTLGEYFVHRALGTGTYDAVRFNGQNFVGTDDFQWRLLFDTAVNPPVRVYPVAPNPIFAERIVPQQIAGPSLYLQWLWGMAAGEWF